MWPKTLTAFFGGLLLSVSIMLSLYLLIPLAIGTKLLIGLLAGFVKSTRLSIAFLYDLDCSFLLLFNCSCSEAQKANPKAIQGEIDLRKWDFQTDGMVNLSGKWEFYWGQLLRPEDFKNQELSPEYIYVPQGWSGGKEESRKYPDDGYATYRLKIKLPEKQTEEYRLLFTLLFSATKVYLNGELLTECGNVSTSAKNNRAGALNFDDYFNKNN